MAEPESSIYRVGDTIVYVDRREILTDGKVVSVEARVFDLLSYFLRVGDRMVSKDELLDDVWKGRVVGEAALYRAIKLVRGLFPFEVIRTVHGRGYRWVAGYSTITDPATSVESAASASEVKSARNGWIYGLFALAAFAVVVAWAFIENRGSKEPSSDVKQPLAVLPLTTLEVDDELSIWASEIAADVRTALARVPDLSVLGPVTSASFESLDDARTLGVAHLLTGTLRRISGSVQVSVELVDVADGTLQWSNNYHRSESELDQLPEDVADGVVEQMALTREHNVEPHAQTSGTAYARYLKARHLWRQRTPESLEEARRILEALVQREPGFARAHEALAAVYMVLPSWQTVDPESVSQLASSAAREALRLDPELGEARAILASEAQRRGDWALTDQLYRQAIEREPGNPTLLHWYAEFLLIAGQLDRAQDYATRAVNIDPLAPITQTVLAWAHAILNDPGSALHHAKLGVELGMPSSQIIRAWALRQMGRADAAADAVDELLSPTDATGMCGLALRGEADAGAASRALTESSRRDELALVYHVVCLGMLGHERDVETLLKKRPFSIPYAIIWASEYRDLRKTPWFQERLTESGLPGFWRAAGIPWVCNDTLQTEAFCSWFVLIPPQEPSDTKGGTG